MADTPSSAGPSSSGSNTDVDMRDMAEWQAEVAKTFKVSQLEELFNAKGLSRLKPCSSSASESILPHKNWKAFAFNCMQCCRRHKDLPHTH